MKISTFESEQKRKLYVEAKKGGCVFCGSYRDLEFHHVESKHFHIGHGLSSHTVRPWQFKRELKKCVVLCHDCHLWTHKRVVEI